MSTCTISISVEVNSQEEVDELLSKLNVPENATVLVAMQEQYHAHVPKGGGKPSKPK